MQRLLLRQAKVVLLIRFNKPLSIFIRLQRQTINYQTFALTELSQIIFLNYIADETYRFSFGQIHNGDCLAANAC